MKRSKKRWDWTKKNLRKTQSKHKRGYWKSPPKSYRRSFTKSYKAQNKRSLLNEIRGTGKIDYVMEKTWRSESSWCWW